MIVPKVLNKNSLVIDEQRQVHPTMKANNVSCNEQILEADHWICSLCTLKNEYSRKLCIACDRGQRPEGSRPNSIQRLQVSSDTTLISVVDVYPSYKRSMPSTPLSDSDESTFSKLDSSSTQYEMEKKSSSSATSVSSAKMLSSDIKSECSETIVYISDLPLIAIKNSELEEEIRRLIENLWRIKLIDVKCYLNFGIGLIHVANKKEKDYLVNEVGAMALDAKRTSKISFINTLEMVSYIVLDVKHDNNDTHLPTAVELSHRWSQLYGGERLHRCSQLNIQFANIYRVVSTSFEQLVNNRQHQDFSINGRFARVYFYANCSFLEDLPQSLSEDQLRQAVGTSIGRSNLPSSSLYVRLNKRWCNACILATDTARPFSAQTYLTINGKPYSKKDNLSCRLSVHPIPSSFAIQRVINHSMFAGKVVNHKQSREYLIVEL